MGRSGSYRRGTRSGDDLMVTRYMPDSDPPVTEITLSLAEVSQPGNTTLAWKGTDLWRSTPDVDLQYAYRLDRGDWSFFSGEKIRIFEALSSGDHTFEVKARDRDFNEDPTPASVMFTVVPPIWQQPWFIGLMVVLLGGIGFQTGRVVRRDRRLSVANHELQDKTDDLENANSALSDANKELFGHNRELQQERLVERIRGEVQAMEKAEDFDNLLSTLAEDLKAVGLNFTTCGIDVLDEPIDKPTMAHFETHGFHYTAYTIDPEGEVLQKSYNLPAPFPDVIEENLQRFIAGEPWQGMSSDTVIVETPIAQYGRLRLTASERERFTDEEIETLQDFATAIALGYTRYLDFVNLESANKEIQVQTQRKSAFLASMSHELRTPITAMKGFVDNILDGIGGKVNERHERYLTRVTDNATRLLELVNDLLDLSKIEAGRMDVDAAPFSVKHLIESCCGIVEPLVKSGVRLVQEVEDEADKAHTDEGKLRHVIGNLLSNAVKFTEEGEIAVRVTKIHDQLVITVSDTGIGMPEEALDTIFDEFEQVGGSEQEQKGTGLGLAITRKYTELLGGSIGVESQVGKGSTFTVRVPVVYEEG